MAEKAMTPCSIGNHRDCAIPDCDCTDDPGGFFGHQGHHRPHPIPADPKKNETIQTAIKAIEDVMKDHENHLYPADDYALMCAREHLLIMQRQGFK